MSLEVGPQTAARTWPALGAHDALGHACDDDACVGAAERRAARAEDVRLGLRLEGLTVGWNLIEGVIAVGAALRAGSVALLGFGIDSFVEMASGLVLVWRLRAERGAADTRALERLDRRAQRLVGASLAALSAWVAWDATRALWAGEHPEASPVGLALTLVSIAVMLWLGRAKRRLALRLRSRAMQADAFQTTACFWLSVITLGGISANALLGWWWADPLAALGMSALLLREGRESWRGEGCASHAGCA